MTWDSTSPFPGITHEPFRDNDPVTGWYMACQGKRPWMIHYLSRDKLVLAAVLPAFYFIVALIPYVMPKFCQLRLNILHYIATPIWNLLTSEYYVSYLLAMLTLLNVDCVVLLSSLLLRSKGNYILELLTFLRFSFREVTFLMRVVLHFRETHIYDTWITVY